MHARGSLSVILTDNHPAAQARRLASYLWECELYDNEIGSMLKDPHQGPAPGCSIPAWRSVNGMRRNDTL